MENPIIFEFIVCLSLAFEWGKKNNVKKNT